MWLGEHDGNVRMIPGGMDKRERQKLRAQKAKESRRQNLTEMSWESKGTITY